MTSHTHSSDFARTEVFEAIDAGGAVRQLSAESVGVDGAAQYAGFSSGVSEYAPKFVDLDGDLDLDWIGSSVRINGLRDLTIEPRSRFGGTLTVEVFDRAFLPDEVAVVYLGLLPAQTVIPGLGTMLVDPSVALVTVVDVAAVAGRATVEFALPAITLPGTTPLYAQAMLLDGNGAVRALTTRSQALVW